LPPFYRHVATHSSTSTQELRDRPAQNDSFSGDGTAPCGKRRGPSGAHACFQPLPVQRDSSSLRGEAGQQRWLEPFAARVSATRKGRTSAF